MIPLQNVKTVVLANVNAGNTITGSVDALGFRAIRISAYSDSVAAPTTASILEESDDELSWSEVPGTTPAVDWTPVGNTTEQPKIAWYVDLRGRKRYLRATCAYAGKLSDTFLVADLVDPADGITTAAEAGVANGVGF